MKAGTGEGSRTTINEFWSYRQRSEGGTRAAAALPCRLACALALSGVLVALSACSGGGDAPVGSLATLPPTSSSPSPSQPVTPTPSTPGGSTSTGIGPTNSTPKTVQSVAYSGTAITVPGVWEAEDFDRGGEGIAYHDTVAGNSGGVYRPNEDVDIFVVINQSAYGYAINNFETGEWLAYTIDVAATGVYAVALNVSSASPGGAFHVEVDGADVTGSVSVPNSGDWSAFQWVEKDGVALTAGVHVLRVVVDQEYFDFDSMRITADQPPSTDPITVPTPDPATVTFSCTFTTSPADCGFQEQSKQPGRATVSSMARDGVTGVQLHTEPGDDNVENSGIMERDDLWLTQDATDGYEGVEQWWAHSLYLPDDFVVPTWQSYVFFDFHNSYPGGGPQANFHVLNNNGVLTFQGYGGVVVGNGPINNPYSAAIGPIQKNVWYDFVYHVRWSSASDGFFEAWVNGSKKLSHHGPTMYAGQGVYLKLANYHVPICDPWPACDGSDTSSSVIHARIIRGTTALAVSSGPLEGVLGVVNGVLTPIAP